MATIRDVVGEWVRGENKKRKAYWYLGAYFFAFLVVMSHAVSQGYSLYAFLLFVAVLPVVDLARLDLNKLVRSKEPVPDDLLAYLADSDNLDMELKAKLAQDLCDLYMLRRLTFKGLLEIDLWYLERKTLAEAFAGVGYGAIRKFRVSNADDLISPTSV